MGLFEELMENIPSFYQAQIEERGQDGALKAISEKIDCGEKIIVYEGRTGVGKSIINYAIAKQFPRSFYLTPKVELVKQVAREQNFVGVQSITGAKNYPCTISVGTSFSYKRKETKNKVTIVADNWSKANAPCYLDEKFNYAEMNLNGFGCGTPNHFGQFQVTCPYAVDLVKANEAEMVATTIDLFLSSYHLKKKRKTIVIDEVHNLESVVEKYLGLEISFKDLTLIEKDLSDFSKEIGTAIPIVKRYLDAISIKESDLRFSLEQEQKKREPDIKAEAILRGSLNRITKRIEKIGLFLDDSADYDFYLTKFGWCFKPKSFENFFQKKFKENCDLLVMSSATLPRPFHYFTDKFGFSGIAPIYLKPVFDWTRSPIYVVEDHSINYRNKFEMIEKDCLVMAEIFRIHSRQRGIVGCNSKWLVEAIVSGLKKHLSEKEFSRVLWYRSSNDCVKDSRDRAQKYFLNKFREIDDAILIGTNLDEGHDFNNDLCRFIVIPKIPFLDLSDDEVKKKKQKMGSAWYDGQAAMRLVQLVGRGMRHKNDFCKSYVFDKNLLRLTRNPDLFPKDVLDSIIRVENGGKLVEIVKKTTWWENSFSKANSLKELDALLVGFEEYRWSYDGGARLAALRVYEEKKASFEGLGL